MEQKKDLILKVSGVTKRFPGVLALNKVSLEIPKGVVYGIVGENGAGKSTLMKILSSMKRMRVRLSLMGRSLSIPHRFRRYAGA